MIGYVASSFKNKEAVRKAIGLLRFAGHEVTHDWTGSDPGDRKGKELFEYCQKEAIKDIEKGVRPAQFIVVLHDDRGRGMLIEFGGAIYANDKLLIVVGPPEDPMEQVFYTLPNVNCVKTIEEAVAIVNAAQAEADALTKRIIEAVKTQNVSDPAKDFTLTSAMVSGTIDRLLNMMRDEHAALSKAYNDTIAYIIIASALGALLEHSLNNLEPEEMRDGIRAFGERLAAAITIVGEPKAQA